MNLGEVSLVLFAVSVLVGGLGSLLGLGGGFVIVPVLTLAFHLDIRLAIGTSIVAVTATSSAAAARNVTESITNLRVATFLALATTVGAVTGALLSSVFDARLLFGLFGLIIGFSGFQMLRRSSPTRPSQHGYRGHSPVQSGSDEDNEAEVVADWPAAPHVFSATGTRSRLATRLALDSAYFDHAAGVEVPYVVSRTGLGLGLMYLAGIVSGLLGIGSGVLKVPAMDLAMNIPMKVSTATSNLLIGLTAASSAVVYFARGDVDPLLAGPVALGILLGATIGSKHLVRIRTEHLRALFVTVLGLVAVQMLLKAIS